MREMMKRSNKTGYLCLSLLLCIMVFWGLYLGYQAVSSTPPPTSRGEKAAPSFELPDAQGKKYRLEDFKGNVVILHFWASWCPPCLDEIPQWVELGTTFHGEALKLVAISLDQKWEDAL